MSTQSDAAQLARDRLGDEVCEVAACTHAGIARLVSRLVAFDDARGWAFDGVRSCADWASINTGLDVRTAQQMLVVGRAVAALPRIAAAFAAGQVSFDKVRSVCRVATPADEEIWLQLAQQASSAQLARICRAVRKAIETDAPARAEAHMAQRGLWAHWGDDGMLRIQAVLPPDDGAAVIAAIKSVSSPRRSSAAGPRDESVPDPALDGLAARRADALVALCETALVSTNSTVRSGTRMLVHVDVGVLTGTEPDGRAHLDNGPALSAATVRRLGCDAEIVAVTERDGLPIDVGRAHRLVHTPLRRALQVRDQHCRFPACMVPAQLTHAHHVRHWIEGGRTDLNNVVSLCGFHHRRLHDGAYRIRGDAGSAVFETAAGRPITVAKPCATSSFDDLRRSCPLPITAATPRAAEGGERLDFAYAVGVVADACLYRRARAGPAG